MKKDKQMNAKKRILSFFIAICTLLCLPVGASALSEPGSDEFFADRDLIARAIEKTAPDASYVARLAVASVIVNRVKSKRFPNDVRAVIYERGEIECVRASDFETCAPSYLSRVAARDALLGFDVTSGALYYKRGHISESDGTCFFHSGFLFYKERPA